MEDNIVNTLPKIKELILKSDRTIETASLKLMEELGEFVSANFALKSYKNQTPEQLQEEIVDVLQNALSLYFLVQSQYPFDAKTVMTSKNKKWEDKYIKTVDNYKK